MIDNVSLNLQKQSTVRALSFMRDARRVFEALFIHREQTQKASQQRFHECIEQHSDFVLKIQKMSKDDCRPVEG